MSKFKVLISLVVFGLIVVAIVFTQDSEDDTGRAKQEAHYPIEKHFKWRYKVSNKSDKSVKDVELKIFSPVSVTANQKLISIDSSRDYRKEVSEEGNGYLIYNFEQLQPFQTVFIDVKAAMKFSINPQPVKNSDTELYLSASKFIESDALEIVSLVKKLKQKNEKETLRSIYRWINNNLSYKGYIKNDLGALYALEHKTGDCTEYAYLMAALARAADIPARVSSGYVYPESSLVKSEDFHNWVEVYVEDRWWIIDPQKQRFMERLEEYLTVHIFPPKHQLVNSHQVIISSSSLSIEL